jgi:hypothetical protein
MRRGIATGNAVAENGFSGRPCTGETASQTAAQQRQPGQYRL